MQVKFFATLRAVVGGPLVELDLPEGATVRQVIDELVHRYPGLERELLNEAGELYQHVHVFVGGRDANFLEKGLDTPLKTEDVIGVFPAVGGG
jgi:sulfur-carrier protein